MGPTLDNGIALEATTLHIALVTRDIRVYDQLRNNVYVISPPLWPGKVELHVLVNPKADPQDIALKLALVDLGMADPYVLGLNEGLQISMGWPNERDRKPDR